jgi:hypothetical protein
MEGERRWAAKKKCQEIQPVSEHRSKGEGLGHKVTQRAEN